jgi:CheY-like chemotaxis protein
MPSVLIADDSKVMRLKVARTVQRALPEASIAYAANGPDVIKACLEGSAPDLMVLDIHMPVLNGLEVLRQLSAQGTALPVVVVYTASRDDVLREQCLAAGATAVVTKSREDLDNAIHHACQTFEGLSDG